MPSRTSSSSSSSSSSSIILDHFETPSARVRLSPTLSHLRQPAAIRPQQPSLRTPTHNQNSQADAITRSRSNVSGDDRRQKDPLKTTLTNQPGSPHSLPRRVKRIGLYTISLSTEQFRINHHTLGVANYAVANRFFDDLIVHQDKLPALDQALTDLSPLSEWRGIPGWKVHPHGISMLAEALGIRDV